MKKKADKEQLYNLFIIEGKTLEQIGKLYNVGRSTVGRWLQSYGIEQSEEQRQFKIRKSNFLKYGTETPTGLPVVREKIKQTSLEKYGTESPTQSKEVKQKIQNTFQSRYKSGHPLKEQTIRASIKKTSMEKYGTPFPSQNENVKNKIRQTNTDRYGVDYYSQKHLEENTVEILSDSNKFKEYVRTHSGCTVSEMAVQLGCSLSTITQKSHLFNCYENFDHFSSCYEKELGDILNKIGVGTVKTRSVLYPYEVDLYSSEYNIGIEFNGDYWHNVEHVGRKYHYDKSQMAFEKNVFLYHIFEYEWLDVRKKEIIISQLTNLFHKNNKKIYGRQCQIKKVEPNTSGTFLQYNHLQGKDRASIRLGLYYNNELVSLMTFCKPRFNKNYNWELSRFCSLRGTNVVGGAQKLFKYFLTNFCKKGENIISYSNIAKTKGTLYKNLGFRLVTVSPPNYVWIDSQHQTKTRYQCQMKNEKQIMQKQGWYQIFDCGNKVWEYFL